jgi:hypothetical protein
LLLKIWVFFLKTQSTDLTVYIISVWKSIFSSAYSGFILSLNNNEVTSLVQIIRATTSQLLNKHVKMNSMVESLVVGGS